MWCDIAKLQPGQAMKQQHVEGKAGDGRRK
jgi:hypothetical protein